LWVCPSKCFSYLGMKVRVTTPADQSVQSLSNLKGSCRCGGQGIKACDVDVQVLSMQPALLKTNVLPLVHGLLPPSQYRGRSGIQHRAQDKM
jgi:hypothetical protein